MLSLSTKYSMRDPICDVVIDCDFLPVSQLPTQ